MKKFLAIVMLVVLTMTAASTAFAQEITIIAKISKTDVRVGAYAQYLADMYLDGYKGKIRHIGIVDINKDTRPELFYILNEDGEWSFHFAVYEDGEVVEMEVEDNYISQSPKSIALTRYRVNGSKTNHVWVLRSTGKNASKRYEQLYNVIRNSSGSITNKKLIKRTWKSSKSVRYFVNDGEVTKTVYRASRDEVIVGNTPETTSYKNKGIIIKVPSPKKLTSVISTLDKAANKWKKLPPVTK
ncbi:hypothetical protein LJC33_07975 [Eubacteriales bacterium OttesenSCG-928-N13]|nr:hypothetical protein [Eubacteriales bacterium OttesenSCG-928-N13]